MDQSKTLSSICKDSVGHLNLAIKLFSLAEDIDLTDKSKEALLFQAVDALNNHITVCLDLQTHGMTVCLDIKDKLNEDMKLKASKVSIPTLSIPTLSPSASSEDESKPTNSKQHKLTRHPQKKNYR